jgi:hypothetical protein
MSLRCFIGYHRPVPVTLSGLDDAKTRAAQVCRDCRRVLGYGKGYPPMPRPIPAPPVDEGEDE